ncbi:hypothetical protein KC333_g6952 [Hortaea werneckii]|nr:hypothetical protein KC333_g6952 [Hortaea werneckii]KAI7309782.1 hypothetical protein KC326_g6933 [Hortaea werneckii]
MQLPRPPASEDPATTLSHALHQFWIRCLWARIYASLYAPPALARSRSDQSIQEENISAFHKELKEWICSIPPEPLRPRTGLPLCTFGSAEDYKITYNETILLLFRGELIKGKQGDEQSFLECMRASSEICDSCKTLYVGKPINYTWSTLHVIFLAGLTYMHCLWVSPKCRDTTRLDKVSETLTKCTMLLTIMAERWHSVGSYRDLFEPLASKTMALVVKSSQNTDFASDRSPIDTNDVTQRISKMSSEGAPDVFEALLTKMFEE